MSVCKVDAPIEIIDTFHWKERSKIITRDVHEISGLMNFTYQNRLTAEPSTPLHYHTDIMEIHCVVKGRRNHRLYRDGRWEDHACTGGEAFVIFPGECHVTGSDARQEPCELYAVQLNLAEADRFLGLNAEKGGALCCQLKALKSRHLRLSREDLNLIRIAFGLFSTQNPTDRDEGSIHLLCFIYRLLKLPSVVTPVQTPSDVRIRAAIRYIEENIADPLPLEPLASLTGYSLSRFKTKFREEIGQTPAGYITALKVERAKEALRQSDQSITDIAYSLGWSSSNYFCAVFKKLMGVSPLKYRRQSRAETSV